jgi:kinesin family protein 5
VFFLAVDALDLPFLNAYLDSLGLPNFKKGCNFAAAGSTILPATASSICPFSFGIQVSQFLRFKARALELLAAKGIYYSLICFVKLFVATMIVR